MEDLGFYVVLFLLIVGGIGTVKLLWSLAQYVWVLF